MINETLNADQPVRRKRRRGTHSTKCKNPNPVHTRRADFKKLPGAYGYLYRIAKKKDVAKHPYFVYTREAIYRHRHFRPERANLIKAFACAVLDCLDIATGMTTRCLEQIAADLDVTNSRISRLVNEVFIPAGLMHVHVDNPEKQDDFNFGLCFDSVHGLYFPKMLVVTDAFYKVVGANEELLAKLHQQADEHLQLNKSGLAKPGEVLSLVEARNRRRDRAFKISWERRKDAARSQRKRAKVASIETLDDRQFYIAQQLIKSKHKRYMDYYPEELEADVWSALHNLGAASPPGSKRKH